VIMDMFKIFKSVLEQDRAPIVLCDLEDTIIYMNPSAIEQYKNNGGEKLLGQSLKDCHPPQANELIDKVVGWFKQDKSNNLVYTYKNTKQNKDVYMVALRDESGELIGYYEKHEFRNNETMNLYDI